MSTFLEENMKSKSDIGVVGLAVMGENLILNMASKGFTVTAYNRSYSKVESFINGRAVGQSIRGADSIESLVASLEKPRKVMLMVKSGQPVDDFIELLIINLFSNENVLIEGVHGIDKTVTAKLFAKVIQTDFSRIQFTPDLMPIYILGTFVFNVKHSIIHCASKVLN